MNIWKKMDKVNKEFANLNGVAKFMFIICLYGIGLFISLIIGDAKIVGMAFILVGILLFIARKKNEL